MVTKILVLVALVSSGIACQCGSEEAENLNTFQPSQALDIFKGFLHGVGANPCAYTNCYYNATYTITQIQFAITQLETLIDNFNYQLLLKLVCGGLSIDFGDIYRICDVQNLINSYQVFTTTAGLKQAGLNFLYDIGVFKAAFENISQCSTNFQDCGFNIGLGWRTLTGYGMPNITTSSTEEFNPYQGDVTGFFNGVIEGLDCPYLRGFRAELTTFIQEYTLLLEEDITHGEKLVESYREVVNLFEGIKLPTVTPEKLVELYMNNHEFIEESLLKLEECQGYDCGVVVGKVIDLVF